MGKEAYSNDGKALGRVSKVYLDGVKIKGLRVGRKRFDKEDIVSQGEVIVINA